jgi:hypothetical protein
VQKTFPTIVGNGIDNLRTLILTDERGRLHANRLLARWQAELTQVPAAGQKIVLVEVGAHCRGSTFLNATELCTPALCATLTRLINAVPGYAFGRIDLRVPSAAHLQAGTDLQVLELNGVASESADVYHPGTTLLCVYRTLFKQWARAFAIGAAQAKNGAPVTPPLQLWRLFRADLKRHDSWF